MYGQHLKQRIRVMFGHNPVYGNQTIVALYVRKTAAENKFQLLPKQKRHVHQERSHTRISRSVPYEQLAEYLGKQALEIKEQNQSDKPHAHAD